MARPRTPLAKAFATGEAQKRPGRYRDRKEPRSPELGRPTAFLDEMQRRCWAAFKKEIPWLRESDRALVEGACVLRAKAWAGTLSADGWAQLRLCISAMGGTPTNRTKIQTPDDAEYDPAEAFLN
jgi:hypothetical protein